MNKHVRAFRIVAVIVLVMVLAGSIAVLYKNRTSRQIATLSDGSKLKLIMSNYGTKYIHLQDSTGWWDRLLPEHDRFMGLMPSDDLTLAYFYYPIKKPLKNQLISLPIQKIVLSDDTGSSLLAPGVISMSWPDFTPKVTIQVEHACFPRRGNTLTAHIYDKGSNRPAAEFSFPNPLPKAMRNFPVWKPESLPASHTNGDMTVTAERFISFGTSAEVAESGGRSKGSIQMTAPLTQSAALQGLKSQIQLNLSSAGRSLENYKVHSAEISDPTGNKWNCVFIDQPKSGVHHSPITCSFTDEFVDKEPVVKLRLTLSRQGKASIPPKDLVQVTGLKPLARWKFVEDVQMGDRQFRGIPVGGNPITEPGPASDYGSVSHISLAGIPVDVCVLKVGIYQIPPMSQVCSFKDCVVLILPENATSIVPRITVKNEKGEVLALDKTSTNLLAIEYTPPKFMKNIIAGSVDDEWKKYIQMPKTTTYAPATSVFSYKGFPRVLMYALPTLKSGSVLNLSIDVNPLRTFEFILNVPPDLLAH